MRTNFILIDFENVQPKDMGLLKDGPFKLKLFLGPNQSKVPVALAVALHSLGSNAEYLTLEAAGRMPSISTSPTTLASCLPRIRPRTSMSSQRTPASIP